MKKSELKSIIKEVLKENDEQVQASWLKGDIESLIKIINNQEKSEKDWPKIKADVKGKSGDIHVELQPEEIVFVFNKETLKLKGIYCYRD